MSINTAQFLTVHSNDQCKMCLPSDVMRSPKPFLTILEYCKQSKSEAREGLGTRLCNLFASYPACCQDYAVCHLLRLLQSFQSLVTSSCSWSIWTLYRFRQSTRSRICAPWLAFSRAKGRSAAELEEARIECAGRLCTLGCKSGFSTTRKRASNPGTA